MSVSKTTLHVTLRNCSKYITLVNNIEIISQKVNREIKFLEDEVLTYPLDV